VGLAARKAVGYYVARLDRPYDYRVLIETYVYTKRPDFVHADIKAYYEGLLNTLEGLFGLRLSRDALSFDQRVLWMLFEGTVYSLVRITSPWDGYLDATLLHRKLEQCGEPGQAVDQASALIHEANKSSETAHHNMLYALFLAIFGKYERVVTSEELLQAGFDDAAEELHINHYYESF
jgi:hypothetical protein